HRTHRRQSPHPRRCRDRRATPLSSRSAIGMNAMVRTPTAVHHDLTDEAGQEMSLRILDHVRERMVEFQEQTGTMYNLEATPAEGATYRFAKEDRARFPGILT